MTPSTWVAEHRPLLERLPRGRALDVACGSGRNAFFLASLGFAVDAVDVDPAATAAVDARAARSDARVRVTTADVTAEPFPAPAYEVVVNVNFLERSLFGPIADALAPGGLVLFETFTRDHVEVLGRRMNRDYLLEPNELLRAFDGLRVLHYRDAVSGDHPPRAVASLVARRDGP